VTLRSAMNSQWIGGHDADVKDDNVIRSVYTDGTYRRRNPTWHSEDSAWKADQTMKMMDRHRELAPRTVCEVGCGAGQVLAELQKKLPKWTSFSGYEISPDAFKMCQPKTNESLNFNLLDFSEFKGEPFDLLLVLDVVEHVSDYLGFLRDLRDKSHYVLFHIPLELTVHSLMRGVLMLNRTTYGHLHHFTKDTALATLQDCGYKVLDWFYTPSVSDVAQSGIKAGVSSLLRRTGFRMAPDESVLLLGGYALMVLTVPSVS
jgi:2-polyprenyl-3-methyl-5-hydroxy-6-metoxy-1,4-benzoquinol methylase